MNLTETNAILKNKSAMGDMAVNNTKVTSVQNKPVKVNKNICLSVQNKGPVCKGFPISSNSLLKSKFKKISRRESLYLRLNRYQPPLFSQPDRLIRVKDTVNKKEKAETVEKNQAQNNKTEKDAGSSMNIVEKINIIQSPVKSKICIEEKSKENIDLNESNEPPMNLTEKNAILKNKSPKNENKSAVGDMTVNNTKVLHKDEIIHQLSASKVLKKTKISDTKVIFEKEQVLDLKRKTPEKEEFSSVENGEFKSKCPPQKIKKSVKMIIDANNFKKRKRNMSAPSNKMEIYKSDEKTSDTSSKGRRKKCISLSEEPVQNEPIENKKRLSVENKGPASKELPASSHTLVKSQFKMSSRRESLCSVINEDETPLFSQSDMMVSFKSDDTVNKKDDKAETEDKSQAQNNNVHNLIKTDHLASENVPSIERIENKTPEATAKCSGTPSELETAEQVPKFSVAMAALVSEFFCGTHDFDDFYAEYFLDIDERSSENQNNKVNNDVSNYFKDTDSKNSLHIQKIVGKNYEGEDDEYSTNEVSENNAFISSITSPEMKKDTSTENQNDNVNNELLNNNMTQAIEDPDSDKSIAERKRRRIIKKKEFFEDITSRSSAQAKKSDGKQKGSDKKSNSEEDPKQGRKNSSRKTELESEESSEDDPFKPICICRQPHNQKFMIQCENCHEWFHGRCIGLSRDQGRRLEKQNKEWICPNCFIEERKTTVEKKFEEKKILRILLKRIQI